MYNKYNRFKLTDLKYELNDVSFLINFFRFLIKIFWLIIYKLKQKSELKITGLLKIYWNLKNPIKLSSYSENTESNSDQQNSIDDFKATSIKDLNKKKKQLISWDDSSIKNEEKNGEKQQMSRAHTVRYKQSKPRPGLAKEDPPSPDSKKVLI